MKQFLYDFWIAVVTGVVTAVAIGAGSFVLRDQIHDWLVTADPTCADPGHLIPLKGSELSAQGTHNPGNEASDAVDGYDGSWWVPLLDSPRARPDRDTWHVAHLNPRPSTRTLIVHLESARDVRLVCVVDGMAESDARYAMHGSVAQLAVWGDGGKPTIQSLQRLTAQDMQTFQDASGALGRTATVRIRVEDVFAGRTVESFDPDDCHASATSPREVLPDGESAQQRDGEGCIRAPVPQVGIAEVLVYVRP